MTSPPVAQMRCPFCQGIVRPGDVKCKWCLSPLKPGMVKQTLKPERAPVAWSKSDSSYGDHVAWKTWLAPDDRVLVQEGETAAHIQDGRSQVVMSDGTGRAFASLGDPSANRIEVLFSKTAVQSLKWGEGDLTTSDGISLGASGTISFRSVDPAKLQGLFPPGQAYLSMRDLRGPILGLIKSILSNLISQWVTSQVLSGGKRMLEEMASSQLASQFGNLGLEVSEFDIRSLSFPEEVRRAVERERARSIEAEGEAAELEQLKKVGVDVNKLTALKKVAEKAGAVQLVAGDYVAGDYVAGSSIQDSVVLRSNVGPGGKAEDAAVTDSFTVQCPSCKAKVDPRHKFCNECGARIRACTKCRIVIPEPGRFCYQCGSAIA